MPDRTPDVVRVEHRLAETDRGLASIRPAASPAARIEPQVRLSAPPSSSVEALSPTAWPALSPRRLSQPGPSLPAREPGGEQMLVQVSIGRIEVRTPAPERPKPARADATGPMSLDEYLRRRNGIA
jgi:hypothetical protein